MPYEQTVTDRQLECLAFIFNQNHLSNALELVYSRRVKRLTAERSGRSLFQVQGKSAKVWIGPRSRSAPHYAPYEYEKLNGGMHCTS